MKGKVLKITRTGSKYGGEFTYVFFKLEDGRSARTCLSPQCGNFKRWKDILWKITTGQEVVLDGLVLKKQGLVDADSFIKEVQSERIL